MTERLNTMNDLVLTEQYINIPIQNSMCSAASRRGDLDEALKHAENLVNHAVALRLRINSLRAEREVARTLNACAEERE